MIGNGHTIKDKFTHQQFLDFLQGLDLKGGPWSFKWSRVRPNSWPMKKTWRMWMRETAEFMRANGVTMPAYIHKGKQYGSRPFTEQDAHEAFLARWLGVDEDGERFKTANGDKTLMLHAMDQHLAWATERGLFLTVPEDGEFMKCKAAQEV